MRHAEAEPASGGGDHARRLSQPGRAEAAAAGRRMVALARPDFALLSDSVRTRETFDRALPEGAPLHGATRRLYDAAADAILGEVRAIPDEVETLLVIGHNPGVADLARRLARDGDGRDLARLAARFPASRFAVIALDGDTWGAVGAPGRLDRLIDADRRSEP